MSAIVCIHCGKPAGPILSRDGAQTPFQLVIGNGRFGVCNDCFWDRADAAIVSIVAAKDP